LDAAEIAYFLRADEADVDAVLHSLADAGRVADSHVVKWGNRQFQSDRSKDRVAAYRERKRAERSGDNCLNGEGNGEVTLQERHRNSPETETELDTELEKTEAKASSKKRRCQIPDDWQPSEFAIGTESRKVVDSWPPGELPAQVEQFMAHHRSKRNTFHDPQDAWSTWVLNTRKWGIGRNERPKQASLTSVVHRLLVNGGTDGGTGEDVGLGSANVDERGATRALAARGS
jgi:hypothetical protein